MRAQLRDLMEKHEQEMGRAREKHDSDVQAAREKHETELQEKDQALHRLQRQLDQLSAFGPSDLGQAVGVDAVIKLKLEQLEGSARSSSSRL